MNIASLGFFEQTTVARIAATAKKADLYLTDEQVRSLAATEHSCLADTRRISFSQSAAARIIEAFSTSSFLTGPSCDELLSDAIEAFYDLRANFPANVTDNEIIEALYSAFDGEAAGSVGLAHEIVREQIWHEQASLSYEIIDDDGNVYRWDPDEWTDSVQANGWDGERWDDEL